MNEFPPGRQQQLAYRRVRLRAQCAQQRRQLDEQTRAIEHQLSGIDRTIRLVRGVLNKPVLITGSIALLTVIGPKRLLRWVSRAALYYTTARRVAGMFAKHTAHLPSSRYERSR